MSVRAKKIDTKKASNRIPLLRRGNLGVELLFRDEGQSEQQGKEKEYSFPRTTNLSGFQREGERRVRKRGGTEVEWLYWENKG